MRLQHSLTILAIAALAWMPAQASARAAMPAGVPQTLTYHFNSHPMIAGTVMAVNDHQMVVDTDQGERVTLEIDTKTMMPRDVAPGTTMRCDFLALDNCRFYAQRVFPVRGWMSPNRFQAYAQSHDTPEQVANSTNYRGGIRVYESGSVEANNAGMSNESSDLTTPQDLGDRPHGAVIKAMPQTHDYHFATAPLITGRVVTVNDHRIVVNTDQGQQLGVVMDSRTMTPANVETGSMVRIDFSPLADGRYLAKRVARVSENHGEREQLYAHTRDPEMMLASNLPDCGFLAVGGAARVTSVERPLPPEPVQQPYTPPVVEQPAPPKTLPQTASSQPLLLLLGLLSLGSAGLVKGLRKLEIV